MLQATEAFATARWLESQRDVGLVGRTECQSSTIEGLADPDNLVDSFKCGN